MSPLASAAAVLPASLMHSGPVRVLAAFVTINTVMYCVLAVAKMLPRLHPSTWLPRSNRREQERGIHPAGWAQAPGPVPHGPARRPDERSAQREPGAGGAPERREQAAGAG